MALSPSFSQKGATPHLPQGSAPTLTGNTPFGRALSGAQGQQMPPPVPLMPPTPSGAANLKSHSITHPDGTVVTQSYHPPQEGMLNKPKAPKTPTAPEAPSAPAEPTASPVIRDIIYHDSQGNPRRI